MSFKTIEDVKRANKELGEFWFSDETMKFFGSKIESQLFEERYFITSEKPPSSPREYTIREALPDGRIRTVGGVLGFASFEDARKAMLMLIHELKERNIE